jgi:hypothetical protein
MDIERERIIERVRKLFTLASQQDSEEEAKAAAMKAREILEKYDLTLSEVEIEKAGPSLCAEHRIYHKGKKVPLWAKYLVSSVDLGFGVKSFINLSPAGYIFVGVEPDVTIARQTFEYLYNYILQHKLNEYSTKDRNQWRLGFSIAIYRRFEEKKIQESKASQIKGIVLAKQNIMDDYISGKYRIQEVKDRTSCKIQATDAFMRGYHVGTKVPINRPIGEATC